MSERSTPDLYRAALFVASGHSLLRIDRRGPRCIFVFESTPELEALQASWVSGTATVNATQYTHAIRDLKSMVHSD